MNICIAHGGDVSQPSGGTDRVTAMAAGLEARGFEVTLVIPEPAGVLPDRLDDVEVVSMSSALPGSGTSAVRAARIAGEARSIAEREDAVLQLEHSSLAGIGTLRGCRGYVLDMHDLAYPRFDHVETPLAPVFRRGVAWIERRGVDRAEELIVVSEYLRDLLKRRWAVSSDRITVVPNGFFPERLEPYRDLETVTGRVVFLGTLHPKVDVEVLRSIATLSGVSELVIVGDGARREEVKRLANGQSAVRVTGRLPDEEAFDLLGRAAVAVNPQASSELQRSSSPVKLYYYAALGRPMVVTPGPSLVADLVENDAAVAARTASAFVDAVAHLLESPEDRRRLSENASALASGYTWDERLDEVASFYRQRVIGT